MFSLKTTVKTGLKIVLTVFLAVWAIFVAVSLIFGIKGYKMYREAIDNKPIQEKCQKYKVWNTL